MIDVALVPTAPSKLRVIFKDVTLKATRDGDGHPVVIRIRKPSAVAVAPYVKRLPYAVSQDETQTAKERLAKMSSEEKDSAIIESVRIGRALITLAAVSPTFAPVGEVPNDDEADVLAIDDEDVLELMTTIVEWCVPVADDQESSDLKRFRDGDEGGRSGSEPAGEASETPAQP